MLVTLMTDASVDDGWKVGGFGYWIASGRGKKGGGAPFKTRTPCSYNGELKAVICGLHIALTEGLVQPQDKVLIQIDNVNVIRLINREQVAGREDMVEMMSFLWDLQTRYSLTLEARHVKAHSSKKEAKYFCNNHCDARAKEGMYKARAKAIKEAKNAKKRKCH